MWQYYLKTMQTTRTLLQSMLWRGLYYASAFIINIVIARHFQASVSGTIYYISSIYALVLLLTSLSLESGIIYFAAKKEISISKLFNFSIAWSMTVGLFSFLIVSIFFNDGYLQISKNLLLFSSVLYISGNLLITYCSGFFYADKNFKLPNIIIVTGTVLLIVLIPYNGKSVLPAINDDNYFYVYFGSYFLQGICLAIAAGFKYIRKNIFQILSVTDFQILFRYCGLAFLGNVIFFLLYRVDYFFVEKYCSVSELGNYIQVSKLVHLFFILPTILASAVFPLTASGNKETINKLLTLISRSLFFLYINVCCVLAIAGKWLFPFVFGESFVNMYQPFLLLIPGILALSGIFTITAYFAGTNNIRVNITGSVYALVVILVGDIIFIPRYGINAAALVSSLGYITYQIYVIAIFKKEHQSSLSDFFIFRIQDFKQIKRQILTAVKNKNES